LGPQIDLQVRAGKCYLPVELPTLVEAKWKWRWGTMGWIEALGPHRCETCGWTSETRRPKKCPTCGGTSLVCTDKSRLRYKAAYRNRRTHEAHYHRGAFPRKSDAQDWINDNETAIREKRWADPKKALMPLSEIYADLHAKPYAPATVALHGHLFNALPVGFRGAAIGDIERDDVDALLNSVTAPAMRDKTRQLLSAMFNHAIGKGYITSNPARRLTGVPTRAEKMQRGRTEHRRENFLTERELERLVAAMPDRYRALVSLMGRMGLRPGEALALRVGKIDFLRGEILIDESTSGPTKTGEARRLPLPGFVKDELAAHLSAHVPSSPDALVFARDDQGNPVDLQNWRNRVFAPAVKAAGITKPVTPNGLRHTAASLAINAGASVLAVQKLLGHAQPSITLNVYASLFPSSLEDLAKELDTAYREREVEPSKADVVELRR
jgi:integrase